MNENLNTLFVALKKICSMSANCDRFLAEISTWETYPDVIIFSEIWIKLEEGDALITTCWYNTTGRSNITLGGFAITDEMCVNYVYYYPKTNLEVCKSSISDQSLQTYFHQVYDWERQGTSSKLGISDNFHAIEWNPARASILHELYTQSPIYMQCNQSSGDRFPGDWTSLPVTPVLYPLQPPPRQCE